MKNRLEDIIEHLKLQPHPEGGFFRETYRSEEVISEDSLNDKYKGTRNCSTCIYFLLTSDNFSAFHRINQDEVWHFYDGAPILLHVISESGAYTKHHIGIDILNGEVPQYIVKGGNWFAAEVLEPDAFCLIGCTVAPGFSFDDFELADQKNLISQFPTHKALIERLTR